MSIKHDTRSRTNTLLVATGIVLLAVFSLQSQDVPVRYDVTNTPDAGPARDELPGTSGSIPSGHPVPPALQKRFLR